VQGYLLARPMELPQLVSALEGAEWTAPVAPATLAGWTR